MTCGGRQGVCVQMCAIERFAGGSLMTAALDMSVQCRRRRPIVAHGADNLQIKPNILDTSVIENQANKKCIFVENITILQTKL